MASMAILTSFASSFLPRYSGVRPTISPATNIAIDDEQQHAVKAGADAAEDDLAQHDVDHRHHAGERQQAVMHVVDGAAGGIGGDGGEQRRVGDAEADLLALHVAAGLQRARRLVDMQRGEGRIAGASAQ